MSQVERYWIDPSRLVQEGWHQDDTCVVKDWAYDRVVAERDALQALLTAADERADALEVLLRKSKVAVDDMAENCEDQADWELAGSMRRLSQHIDAELGPAKATPDFRMIGTEKMQPMEYDEP
ncbi:hypothetical protein [Pseudomonas sp. AP42]|uniref:hypothetical protein n=1 Tax=Pseudomonas sp. AP42 TaxID=1535632 RepID=UPI00084B284D|nr:hypothetical protein [Pseudomonas sp. AP42]OEC58372.1 hypothetical protein A7K61_21245 [Pseudomonas sp. AP42]